jgi:large subunit ribosomal protein L4e
MARGHRIEKVREVPLVLSDDAETLSKTKSAVKLLQAVHAYDDVEKVKKSKKLRAGKGKMRNRRYRQRRGPLICYNEDKGITKAFRNIPGVELINVNALNLLLLAPGGHLGRFIIWTQGAFAKLDQLYGSSTHTAELKKDYLLPSSVISNPDISRIINSDEIQAVLRPAFPRRTPSAIRKRNPLKNVDVLLQLNPHAKVARDQSRQIVKRKRPTVTKKVNRPTAMHFTEQLAQ